MPAARRTARDARRRRLGQNFLRPAVAERFVAGAGVTAGELVVDIGAGAGALSRELIRHEAEVVAVEADPAWAERLAALADETEREGGGCLRVVHADVLDWRPPRRPFRVVACLPFGSTTAILRHLFDDPRLPLWRADLIVQWEVACKRAVRPPSTLVSTAWAPWWEFRLGPRIPASSFRPVPRVDGGVLVATRRRPPLLPETMARSYRAFVRDEWPFA